MALMQLCKNKIRVEEQTWVAIEPNWTSLTVVGHLKSGDTSGLHVLTSPIKSLSLAIPIDYTFLDGNREDLYLKDYSGGPDSNGKYSSGTNKAVIAVYDTSNTNGKLTVFPYIFIKGADESGSDGATHFDYFEVYYTT